MAVQWDENTSWPNLQDLNDGDQLGPQKVTPQIFNAIVKALIYLKRIIYGGGDTHG